MGKNPWKSGSASFAHSRSAAFFTGFTMRREGPRRGENPAPAGYAVKKVMNSYSQKIVCISSAHPEDTRILRNFCRERTDLFPRRCITVNNSVNCVEIFPPERTNHRMHSRCSLRRRARLCITPAHTRPALHASGALSLPAARSKISSAALPAAAPLSCETSAPWPEENGPLPRRTTPCRRITR